jgi:hypothetical protein
LNRFRQAGVICFFSSTRCRGGDYSEVLVVVVVIVIIIIIVIGMTTLVVVVIAIIMEKGILDREGLQIK